VDSLLAARPSTNTAASIEFRARSYLTANCVQCHQPGGVPSQQANWNARNPIIAGRANLVNGALEHDFGDTNNRVVKLDRSQIPFCIFASPVSAPPICRRWPPPSSTPKAVDCWPGGSPSGRRCASPMSLFSRIKRLGSPCPARWLSHVVQAASSLSAPDWLELGTMSSTPMDSAFFVDQTATNYPVRYYRA